MFYARRKRIQAAKLKMIVPVSVVIPALNAERFIGQAIDSVHAQTLKVSATIMVDKDGTSSSADLVSSIKTTFRRLTRTNSQDSFRRIQTPCLDSVYLQPSASLTKRFCITKTSNFSCACSLAIR